MKGRKYILKLVDKALGAKARLKQISEILELSTRTIQRWRKDLHDDKRKGNTFKTSNALTIKERQKVIDTVCSLEFRNLPPGQIVPRLADRGIYIASESTIYRILKAFGLVIGLRPLLAMQPDYPNPEQIPKLPSEKNHVSWWPQDRIRFGVGIYHIYSAQRSMYIFIYIL
jgi:hypothetical protein